ncbi:glycosyltransferase [Bacteroides sp. 519]|uniref:glycosyltransferase n=1 Tax=Bacteroides sp. 519 TaxID=2302937 RepID=UPI0013D845B4|nr:glycosyltransferase [Bacteroides sp. 519]NDV60227.1 glycosyltransferase [Bacteroides sp. 519]
MKQKTKVLFFIESLAGGGAEKILFTLVKHIDKEKFDVTVAAVVSTGVYVDQIKEVVKFKSFVKTRNRFLYKVLCKLIYSYLPIQMVYRLFIPQGNDVEVAFCEGFATRLLAHSPHKTKIAWVHTDLLANPWTQGVAYTLVSEEQKAYSQYNRVICVSDVVKEAVKQKFGVEAQTLYNPIDSEEILKESEEFSLPEKKRFRMVTTGRLVTQKGYDRLVRVVKKLKDEGLVFELWILGEGVQRNELTAYITDNKLSDYIKLWGFISNPYPYMKASDVFVCSSRSEGYSTAVTEAIILGLPVITTLCSGMKELLGNNQYGVIVDNEDMALFEPLKKVISDPHYLNTLAGKARKRRNDFSISSLMQPIEKLICHEVAGYMF